MDLTVRYAKFDELPRVNELRRTVSELHAEGRPDIFRPAFAKNYGSASIPCLTLHSMM